MKIAIGADHRGFELKGRLFQWLQKSGYQVDDLGTNSPEPCDYPLIAEKVSLDVQARKAERGILICKSGIGMSIAANKLRGVRAALVHGTKDAKLSREHNDANVLILSSDDMTDPAESIVEAWLKTPFEGGRHEKRVAQIADIERRYSK